MTIKYQNGNMIIDFECIGYYGSKSFIGHAVLY